MWLCSFTDLAARKSARPYMEAFDLLLELLSARIRPLLGSVMLSVKFRQCGID